MLEGGSRSSDKNQKPSDITRQTNQKIHSTREKSRSWEDEGTVSTEGLTKSTAIIVNS